MWNENSPISICKLEAIIKLFIKKKKNINILNNIMFYTLNRFLETIVYDKKIKKPFTTIGVRLGLLSDIYL